METIIFKHFLLRLMKNQSICISNKKRKMRISKTQDVLPLLILTIDLYEFSPFCPVLRTIPVFVVNIFYFIKHLLQHLQMQNVMKKLTNIKRTNNLTSDTHQSLSHVLQGLLQIHLLLFPLPVPLPHLLLLVL